VLSDLRNVAEQENEPDEAKVLGELVESADDWFRDYQQQVAEEGVSDPFARAALLQDAWRRRLRQPRPRMMTRGVSPTSPSSRPKCATVPPAGGTSACTSRAAAS